MGKLAKTTLSMKDIADIKQHLKTILPEGIDLVLQAMKELLNEGTDKFNNLILLESRYKAVLQQLVAGTISNEHSQLELNKLRKSILDFIDELAAGDLRGAPTEQAGGTPDIYNGEVFYRIPKTMQVLHEVKCIVRLAFNRQILTEDLDVQVGDVLKDIRISEVMGVELVDPNAPKAFEIRTITDAVQFVEKDLYTEWIFYVKPILEGIFPLILKIAVIEIRDGIERKRNVVLEEQVEIIATEPDDAGVSKEFIASGYTLNMTGAVSASKPAGAKGVETGSAPQAPTSTPSAPSPAPPRPAVLPQKTSNPGRKIAGAMTALLALVVASWALWFKHDSKQMDWPATVAMEDKGYYEDIIKTKPGSKEATIAQQRLDSLETLAWNEALAANDTSRIRDYIEEYPEGRFVPEALMILERGRKPVVQDVIFSWQVVDSLLKIRHEGGFAPFQFSITQQGKLLKQTARDSIGEFSVSINDLPAGSYEFWLQDSEGRAATDTLVIAPPVKTEVAKPVPAKQGVTPKKPPLKKKNPAKPPVKPPVSPADTPQKPPVETKKEPAKPEEPFTPAADKPVVWKNAARKPVYPKCDSKDKEKEAKCTERKIRDFINDKLRYPEAALEKGVQGTVLVYFVVEKDGSITGVEAKNDIGGGCATEAVRIVSQLPRFKPGLNRNGESVRVGYSLPITFRVK
jgi:TonB family protein